jgi:hypothetical protein
MQINLMTRYMTMFTTRKRLFFSYWYYFFYTHRLSGFYLIFSIILRSFYCFNEMSTETYTFVDEFGVSYDKFQKGKNWPIFQNSLYLCEKKVKERQYWKCINPLWRGRLTLSGRTPTVTKPHLLDGLSAVE